MATGMTYARAERLVALRRPRTFGLNLAVPSGMVAILLIAGAPAVHAAVVIAVLFVFFGTFGSAIPLVRDLETGRITRLIHAGASPVSLLLQRVAISVAIDLAQLLPAAAILLAANGNRGVIPVLWGLLVALLFANVTGVWLALLARSIGEAALVSSVTALLLLHMAGIFRTPVPDSLGETLVSVSPFAYLHGALRGALGLTAAPSTPPAVTAMAIAVIALFSLAILPRKTRVFAARAQR